MSLLLHGAERLAAVDHPPAFNDTVDDVLMAPHLVDEMLPPADRQFTCEWLPSA